MAYLGKTPSQATRKRYYKTAGAGDTSVSGTMTVGGTLTFTDGEFVDVSVNGVALVAGTDYNTSTANTIAGLSALTANDQVEIVVYDTFSVFGGNVNADFNINNGNLSVSGTSTLTGAATFSAGFTASDGCTITTADNNPQLTLESTDADANFGPVLKMHRNSSSPADSDFLGEIQFQGENDAGEAITYAQMFGRTVDVSDGTEDGRIATKIMIAGTAQNVLDIKSNEIVINDDSVDLDFRVEGNGDANLLFVDAGNDRIGIGTSSPATALTIASEGKLRLYRSDNSRYGDIFNDNSFLNIETSNDPIKISGQTYVKFDVDGSEAMRISGSKVGIGTSSPVALLTMEAADGVMANQYVAKFTNSEATTGQNYGVFVAGGSSSADESFSVRNFDNSVMYLKVRGDGNVGIGTSSPTKKVSANIGLNDTDGFALEIYGEAKAGLLVHPAVGEVRMGGINSSGTYFTTLYANNSERLRILSSGNVGIGLTNPTALLNVNGHIRAENSAFLAGREDASAPAHSFHDDSDTGIFNVNPNILGFSTAGSERARIDSSGNMLVATTSNNTANVGHGILANGTAYHTRDGEKPLVLNRKSSDGDIVSFRKDDTSKGSIGIKSNRPFFSNGDNSGIRIAGNALHPADQNGTAADNSESLGESSARWTQLFAGTSTIGTSDKNEKQNITSLTDAEIVAAKAISKLFKTFKFKDAVTSKGDAARTHSGVIAQEVQQAMTDAGLDASKYAFWCSDTWTNDDGNEQTRLGVRYAELLAFVGAATEQRLADIETRLTALEEA